MDEEDLSLGEDEDEDEDLEEDEEEEFSFDEAAADGGGLEDVPIGVLHSLQVRVVFDLEMQRKSLARSCVRVFSDCSLHSVRENAALQGTLVGSLPGKKMGQEKTNQAWPSFLLLRFDMCAVFRSRALMSWATVIGSNGSVLCRANAQTRRTKRGRRRRRPRTRVGEMWKTMRMVGMGA